MRSRFLIGGLAILLGIIGCQVKHATAASWAMTKAAQSPVNALPSEFKAPFVQPLATLAWEDGIYISRDGLSLYATYIPMDLLKAVVVDRMTDRSRFSRYFRGPVLAGQDFSHPIPHWLHSDIAISQRRSTGVPFPAWRLSNMRITTGYDLGAAQGVLDTQDAGYDAFVYTRDDIGTGGPKIALMLGVGLDPSPAGTILGSNLNSSGYEWDNPHVERLGGTSFVLFFDSMNVQGVSGGKNTFFSTTADNGATWTVPVPVTTVNNMSVTHLKSPAQQPHLFHDGTAGGRWWLYFSAVNPADGLLAVYRAPQVTPGNWDGWGLPELVVSAGGTAGVGEPSLTAAGDLSFVVITRNTSGTGIDMFDADPWYMTHLR